MNYKMSRPDSKPAAAPSTQPAKSNQQYQSAHANPAVNWLTPPELIHESFSHQSPSRSLISSFLHPPTTAASTVAKPKMGSAATTKPVNSQQAPSPPISPLTKIGNGDNRVAHEANAAAHDAKDPILFPEEPNGPAKPLFQRELSSQAQDMVSEHIEARKFTPLAAGVKTPKREDYELVMLFREVGWTRLFESTPAYQAAWLERERAQLKMDALARKGGKAKQVSRPIKEKPLMARPAGLHMASANVVDSAIRPRSPSKIVKATGSSRPARINASKPVRSRISATPQPEKKRTTTHADQDFGSIPNYCPPLTTLSSTNVMWKPPPAANARQFQNHEFDLLQLLHPDEQKIASTLRLDPATYLTSKRRIFVARLKFFHEQKPFRKTHAQNACKIDVNKASKLYMAFESVGWFDEDWMRGIPWPDTEV